MSQLPGRRAALTQARKVRPATAIGVGAPLLTLVALLVQAPADTQHDTARRPPQAQTLTSADLFCPASGKGPVRLASVAEQGAGAVTRRLPGTSRRTPVALRAGGTATVDDSKAMLVRASDALAPGLMGARLGAPQPSARECAAPGGVRWFVGAGAGAAHLSTLTLANPDGGPAVADVRVWSTDGELQEIESRGLTIGGGQVSTLALESLAPNARELAVRVVVTRGRLASSMSDQFGKVGEALHTDGLAAGSVPARHQVLPGLTRTASSRVLTLVNPGASEARVTVRVAGAHSTFAPAGVAEIHVPAGRVVVTDLGAALRKLTAGEDLSLVVDATEPVAAGLRATVAGDLLQHPALQLRTGRTGSVVPRTGTSSLVLAAGDHAGTVRVRWDDQHESVVRIAAGTTRAIAAPKGARWVLVDATVPVAGVIRTQAKKGAALLPLRPLVTHLLVPSVRPAWPPS